MELFRHLFLLRISGYMAPCSDSLFTARYSRFMVCFCQYRGMVELLDSGFTPTLSHSMSYAWSGARDLKKQGIVFSEDRSGPNYPLVYGILSTCRTLYFGIAVMASLVMIFAGTFIFNVLQLLI